MRTITGQKDYGLEPKVLIEADEKDESHGASHFYWLHANGNREVFAEIQFQYGPRNDPKSKPGIADSDLLHVLIDRYEGFQTGPLACDENFGVLRHLYGALASTRERADKRQAQGVLGQNKQHVSEAAWPCSECGYTEEDARIHMDHHLCKAHGEQHEYEGLEEEDFQVKMFATRSSHIAAIGYDTPVREIHVEFNDGSRWAYEDADKNVFASFKLASSTGVFFQNYVKGRYKARKLEASK